MIRSSLESKLYPGTRNKSSPAFCGPSFPSRGSHCLRQPACSFATSLPNPRGNFPLGFIPCDSQTGGLLLAGRLYLLDTVEQCRPRPALESYAAAVRNSHRRLAFDLGYCHWPHRRSPARTRGRSGAALPDCTADRPAVLLPSCGVAVGTHVGSACGIDPLWLCPHPDSAV